MGKGTRYHFQKVDAPPPNLDRRSRPSKLQQILAAARMEAPGEWVLAATYVNDEGASTAGRRLEAKEREQGNPIDWEWESRRFQDTDSKVKSRLYLRVHAA